MHLNYIFLLKTKSQDANAMNVLNVFTNLTTSSDFFSRRLFNLQELPANFHFEKLTFWIRLYFRTTKSNFCFNGTEYKGVDDDSRYGGANYKAENHIYSEAGCKGDGDSKHSLQSDGQQQDETAAVPCAERREGVDMI